MATVEIIGIVLSLAFTLWAGVVAFAAKLLLKRIEAMEKQISAGILPRADERLRALERRVDKVCEP